ncbi:cytochrome P450 [Mycobacterium heckeshornense]|uniref:Cytochrome P450 n=2 Tax=Mycobacterium TaxID=1763 RepID=A0A7R7YQE2_9MYCO|nr:cytochrome P450 [Mycobacterium heckeshornense]BCQ07560.1 cytochrome P450 [Mycobacterium heckeshornense]
MYPVTPWPDHTVSPRERPTIQNLEREAISVTVSATSDVYFDPYNVELNADPYGMFRRLREEAPLYYNEQHDFYALSRFADVDRALVDYETFSSARGAILELIKANIEIPPGVIIFEDPPLHDVHRKLLARMFTPRKINALEPKIREFCATCLDPLIGSDRFDFVADLGAQMPMRVIGMLLGVPEEDQEAARDFANAQMRTEEGKPMKAAMDGMVSGEFFAQYIDWRAEHPSDDIMTELLNVEFEDEKGVWRRLTREELLTYVSVVSGAGNETTTRLIGWTGKVLAEHPDQRRELVENPTLIPRAIEELLRFEPPAPHVARYVTRDVEWYGQTVPEGSVMMMLIGAANRDHRQFPPDGDVFDIHREPRQHLTFSVGTHYCLGSALARLEGRIALEEILKRFPEWDVDLTNARLSPTSTVRGWESMVAVIP